MKTAISVPDQTFQRVERRAGELGLSRSEFYARAATMYLDNLDTDDLRAQIDEALVGDLGVDESSTVAVALGRSRLSHDSW